MMRCLILAIVILILLGGCKISNEPRVEKVSVDELSMGPKHNYDFSDEFKAKARYVQNALKEVDNSSYEQWMDGFDRDLHPEQELELWLHMTEVYKRMVEKYTYPEEVYRVIIIWSVGGTYEEIIGKELAHLNATAVKDILNELSK